jgi:hypothetical protein
MSGKRPRRGDEVLVTALACGATVEGAARKAGLSERTVYRRLADPDFQSRLRHERAELARRAAGLLTAASLESVRTLVELQGTALPPAARLGAARAVIGLGMKLREEVDLVDRVAELERRLEQVDGVPDGNDKGGEPC